MAEVNKLYGPLGIYVAPDNVLHVLTQIAGGGISISGNGTNSPGFRLHDGETIAAATYNAQNILALAINDGVTGSLVGEYVIANKKNFGIRFATNDTIVATIGADGVISSNVGTYDALVIDDNDIPNKKYVDDRTSGVSYWAQTGADIYYNTGNVGIGTGSPDARIKVQATDNTVFADAQAYGTNTLARVNNYSNVTNSAAYFDISAGATFASVTRLASINVGGITSTDTRFALMVRNVNNSFYERLSVLGGGNVGIGTDSPSSLLDVAGILTLSNAGNSATPPTIRLVNDQFSTRAAIAFSTSAATDMLFLGYTGNVGIGTSSPGDKLHVDGSIRIEDAYLKLYAGTLVKGWMDYGLSISGAVNVFNNAADSGLSIYDDGHGVFGGELTASDFLLSSDRRLKTDIEYNLSDISIDGLKPTSFYLNGKFKYGFIAQDMLKTHPELVVGTGVEKEDGEIDYYSIKENSILPIVVKEVQQLKKHNLIQQEVINEQQFEIEQLRSEIDLIKEYLKI